uniref:Ankyrin repeat domain-containing protein 32 n=1 Tax=Sheathia arcuata TaxID=340433 RepID=A0A3G1I9B8_9FLOR|nr:ankyrin repeat domain-containing protein 32 [Sheathia arcuata]ART65534.1 ankyrin repeat domain-containing protein 32 [Sheathia arcuata]
MTAVSTGHNSLKYVMLRTGPNILVVFKDTNSFPICKVNTIPIKQAVINTIAKESTPTDTK